LFKQTIISVKLSYFSFLANKKKSFWGNTFEIHRNENKKMYLIILPSREKYLKMKL